MRAKPLLCHRKVAYLLYREVGFQKPGIGTPACAKLGVAGWTLGAAFVLLAACGDDVGSAAPDAGDARDADGGGRVEPDTDSGSGDAGGPAQDAGSDAGTRDAGDGSVDGADCEDDGECASGECVDGVCCESPCDDVCEACNAGGKCEAVADDSACDVIDCDDFDEPCRDYHDLDVDRCAGKGECKTASASVCDDFTDTTAGTECSDPYCDGSNAIAVDECDGAGACDPDPSTVACGDYACDPAGCPTTCASGADCAAGVCDRRDGTCPAAVVEADCAGAATALATVLAACPASPTCYVRVKGTCEPVLFQDKDVYLGSDGTGAIHDPSNGTGIEVYEAPAGTETRLVLDGLAIHSTAFNSGGSGVVCWAMTGEVAELWTFDTTISDVSIGLDINRCNVTGSGDVVEDCFEPMQLVNSTSSFSDCTVQRGSDEGIGATTSTVTLTDCVVLDCAGQGLLTNSCIVNVAGTTFSGNNNTQLSVTNGSNAMVTGSRIENGDAAGAQASSLAALTLDETTVEGNAENGVIVTGASSVIEDSAVRGNGGEGVAAGNGATLTVTRSTIVDNTLRGISVNDSNFTVVNNFIVGNDSDGVRVASTTAITKVFRHNTVVANGTGMQCSGAEGIATIERSLFYNTPNTEIVGCTVDATSDVPGTADACGNGTLSTTFAGAPGVDHHLGATSTCIDAITCDGTTSEDFDAEFRPMGSMCDVGADEAP